MPTVMPRAAVMMVALPKPDSCVGCAAPFSDSGMTWRVLRNSTTAAWSSGGRAAKASRLAWASPPCASMASDIRVARP